MKATKSCMVVIHRHTTNLVIAMLHSAAISVNAASYRNQASARPQSLPTNDKYLLLTDPVVSFVRALKLEADR
jgi:hypothetical protein